MFSGFSQMAFEGLLNLITLHETKRVSEYNPQQSRS